MILPEREAIEKVCGQSMASQNPPRKCLGSACFNWIWLKDWTHGEYVAVDIPDGKRLGTCGLQSHK